MDENTIVSKLLTASSFLHYIGKHEAAEALSLLATMVHDGEINDLLELERVLKRAANDAILDAPVELQPAEDAPQDTRPFVYPAWMAKYPEKVKSYCELLTPAQAADKRSTQFMFSSANCLAMHDPEGRNGLWWSCRRFDDATRNVHQLWLRGGVDGKRMVTFDAATSSSVDIHHLHALAAVLDAAETVAKQHNPYYHRQSDDAFPPGACLAMHDPHRRRGLWAEGHYDGWLVMTGITLRSGREGEYSARLDVGKPMAPALADLLVVLEYAENTFANMCDNFE